MAARRWVRGLASVWALAASAAWAASDDGADVEQLVRWARIDERQLQGPERYRRYDEAIAVTQADADALAAAPERELAWPAWNRLCNRVVALQERRRAADAVALHALLGRVPGRKRPPYVQAAAGAAWAALREPERAIPLLEEALTGYEPGSSDWGEVANEIAWALADAGRLERVSQRLDAWIAATPRRSPVWLDLRVHRVRSNLAVDRLDAAETEATALQAEAPFNASVRDALAAVARARGWPRLALEDVRLAIATDPAELGDRAREYDLLVDLGRTSQAYDALDRARRRDPDAGAVRRASERWALLHRPEVSLETSYQHSSDNSPLGTDEFRMTAWGFTPPVEGDWRLFARVFTTAAVFPDQTVTWSRAAVGADWTPPDWRLRLDSAAGDGHLGGTFSARWTPSDHWELGGHVGTATDAVPLQAWRGGVLVDLDAAVEVAYGWSEATRVALTVGSLRFSDSNVRRSALGSARQRLAGGGAWRVDGTLWLSAGDNSLASAGYFNPSRSASVSGEVTVTWRTWQRLDRSFEQRLVLAGGGTWQDGFGTDPAWSGRYQHVWRLGPALQLDYGFTLSSNPYDGVQTRAVGGYLAFAWRV